MDEIQKVLVKAGRKDLAQKYYLKIAAVNIKNFKVGDKIEYFDSSYKKLMPENKITGFESTNSEDFVIVKEHGTNSNIKVDRIYSKNGKTL